jgi:Flp pilus assembly CpaF family ATPase
MLKTHLIGPYNFNHGNCKAGFYSCCSVRLHNIIEFFNKHKYLPTVVDSSEHYKLYKNQNENENNIDIIFEYFEHYDNRPKINYEKNVDYNEDYQLIAYKKLDYENIIPFVKKYFTPCQQIREIVTNVEQKYNINDYSNICVLFYRGNDKATEVNISNYDDVITYASRILSKHPSIQFLIQSDETDFIERMTVEFPLNSFYFKDEIRHINKQMSSVDLINENDTNREFSKYYLAIMIIMSKCNYVVCGSTGNCSIWITFFRENAKNVIHYLKSGEWVGDIDI